MKLSDKKKIFFSIVFIALLLCLIFSIIPILTLAKYSAPFADDFSFSCETHRAVQNGDSIIQVIKAAAGKVSDVYNTWQGTFSGIFLMAFQPGIFSLSAYRFTTWIMLAALISGVFFFFYSLFSKAFKLPGFVSGIVSCSALILCIQLVPSANQSFYWYNGAVYYTFTYGLTLITYALMICYIVNGSCILIPILSILSAVIGGSNFVTALLSCIILFFATIFLLLIRNPRWKGILIPLTIVVVSLIISAAAPGNAVRQAEYPNAPDAFTAVLLSFTNALHYAVHWITLPYIGLLVFLTPVIWFSLPDSSCKFQYPAVISLLSFCVFSSMFTPHLFAEGTAGPDRLINILYFSFVILSIINLFWWCGFLHRKQKEKQAHTTQQDRAVIPSTVFSALFFFLSIVLGILLFDIHPTSVMALGELKNGDAQEYFSEISARQEILENPSVSDCIFPPVSKQPYLLFFGDMSSDPNDYTNEDASTFYNKNSIKILLDNGK